ncbi:ABC transporter permease, partial [Thioclava sp. BHET1]
GGIDLTFTLDNYRQSLSGFYLAVFLRTILFAVGASAACLLLAYPTAYFMARQPKHRQLLVLLPILVPYFSSFLIRIMSLDMLISRGGALDWLLQSLHLRSAPLDLLDTPTAVFIGMVYAYLPITVIPLYVVLEKVPTTLLEASRDLGAPPWRTFLAVTLPLSRPGIATAAMMTAIPMLGEMVIPMLLGGSRGLLMGKALSIQYLNSQNYPLGSAMAVLVLIAVGIVVAVLARLTRGFEELK